VSERDEQGTTIGMRDGSSARADTARKAASLVAGAAGPAASKAAKSSVAGAAGRKRKSQRLSGLSIPRHFTARGEDPFDAVEWELRTARISNEKGEPVFEQTGCEIPKSWSQLATNVVVSKYFRGHLGSPERESSVRQLIGRVVGRISEWGSELGYFETPADVETFSAELSHLLVNQKVSFNSPVWFNLGVENTPQQASACFINSVDDTMGSIMSLAKTEAMLFKGGSGTGSNLSTG
jgi:ribonucleoside-diphosphate reductase alpha chain